MIKKSLLIWLAIIPLSILNGALREMVLVPLLGINYALPLSGILLCLLIFILCYVFIPKIGKGTTRSYWKIGLLWIILTILFEFGFGLIMGNTFAELIKAYDITTGNLWLLIVLFTGMVSWLTAKLRKLI
ncbi:hypothetical protein JGH11_18495 [Dysgonomonas sp. Marseille-P4677]|uniref:hypothetical protein n=1 Tax=Dysgonomonas sp. Marseille-P4677 TaxID=2364790 RepID=UPI001912097B|nr:hypothetical protein [Dysgonomonas sp. Marseille-P4677]MBK5722864.1 hypothetical protein [Dysgonomonas sp. Marseille-P4677]